MDCLFLTSFFFINIIGALSLIQYCLKPDANNRATTKDILRHDWLMHGPILSIQFNSTTSSSVSLMDQQSSNDYDKIRFRTPPVENSLSPTNSLVELELHTSSFFDTTRLRENSSKNKEQQRRNRVSSIPISTRYLSSNNIKTNSSLLSRPIYRRPVSLSLDDQQTSKTQSINTRRTVSPITYGNNDRFQSPQTTHRYTLAISPESTTTTTPSSYLASSELDSALKDLKSKEIYKYTPASTTVAPSVFTTSAIKFAPAPTRRMSPLKDQENNTYSHNDDSINTASNTNRHSLLTSLELPTYKNRLLDDNNNLVSLKVYE
jgi:serine/threonine protein kinase